MSVLEIQGLSKRYGAVQAVKDISFTVERGDILGIVGESGCGKTTLLRLISGLEAADSGQVLLRQFLPNFVYTAVLSLPLYYLTLAIAKRLKLSR